MALDDFKLADIFADNMVLQQGKPLHVFGTAPDGNEVTVTINGVSGNTVAKNGSWFVTLPSMAAVVSCQMVVSSKREKIVLDNVAVGEVWIAGGQSNMEFPLKYDSDASDVLPVYENSNIRFYDCPKITYAGEEE